jgi:hypothetical protein
MSVSLLLDPKAQSYDWANVYVNSLQTNQIENTTSGELYLGKEDQIVYICQDKSFDNGNKGAHISVSSSNFFSNIVAYNKLFVSTSGNTTDTPAEVILDGPSRLNLGLKQTVVQQSNNTQPVTLNSPKTIIQTVPLTLAPGAQTSFVFNNSLIGLDSCLLTSIYEYTGSQGTPWVEALTTTGSATIKVHNGGGQSLNGLLRILAVVV